MYTFDLSFRSLLLVLAMNLKIQVVFETTLDANREFFYHLHQKCRIIKKNRNFYDFKPGNLIVSPLTQSILVPIQT